MAQNSENRVGQGTFARLYDVQEELSQKHTKPLGRPRNKIKRKPTTIHLTQTEGRNLSHLQIMMNDCFAVNRSELVGVAVDALVLLLEENGGITALEGEFDDLEAFRQVVFDFIKSKNHKIKK